MTKIVESGDVEFEKRNLSYDKIEKQEPAQESCSDLAYALSLQSMNLIVLLQDGHETTISGWRNGYIMDLSVHAGRLYAAIEDRILDVLSEKIVANNNGYRIRTMLSLDRSLFYGGDDGYIKDVFSEIRIAANVESVNALSFFENKMIFAAERHVYSMTDKSALFTVNDKHIMRLCVHGSDLYYSPGCKGVKKINDPSSITDRNRILSICSYSGHLFDGGDQGIHSTLDDEFVYVQKFGCVSAMCGVDKAVAKSLLEYCNQYSLGGK
jgi:hypothetical protein